MMLLPFLSELLPTLTSYIGTTLVTFGTRNFGNYSLRGKQRYPYERLKSRGRQPSLPLFVKIECMHLRHETGFSRSPRDGKMGGELLQ